MESLKEQLSDLNARIDNLKNEILNAKSEAETNIIPLEDELKTVRENKRSFAAKGDFESVQQCKSRENNLQFKISAQWNRYSILKNDLTVLEKDKKDLESQITLEKDRLKRKNQILSQMDEVLDNYRKSQNLRQAALRSNINPDYAAQWFEWGKDGLNETYSYFYSKVNEIDEYFRDLKKRELICEMDRVIEAYGKTGSLRAASEIAGVSPDTVLYWHEWGSKGFGEENTYFFKRISEIKS